ncbi:peptidase S1 [Halalkalibacillus sediminis]|uniref:Peptidase S1 n=1 Tax=Halalkalibacillus sediminis TaxID=2018042 RepID=A0A2I0QQZ2_9BACI|nr:trypsin-like peptidase domain-containing protein [Halalkalibacillus sediminis]PKR76757.1 peptidase S1 [Halalkalibacillus sediminis]
MKNTIKMLSASIIGGVISVGILMPWMDGENQTSTNEQVSGDEIQENIQEINEDGLPDVVEEASKSVVGVTNIQEGKQGFSQNSGENSKKAGTGSGVIFNKTDERTQIITNHHVIEGASEIEVTLHNGDKVKAELVGSDALTDTAVLSISSEHDVKAIEMGDSDELRPGEKVLAIGNPLGLDLAGTVTEGIVSAVDRTIPVNTSAGQWDLDVIQTDAAISPGNSGGALINTEGELIGINSLKMAANNAEGLGFAIPSNDFAQIVEEIIENGHVERPYLGVGLQSLNDIPQFYLERSNVEVEDGLLIANVEEGSAADQAGLEVEDIITEIDGEPVEKLSSLSKYMYNNLEPGDSATLTIVRDNQELQVEVTLQAKDK